MATQKPKVYVGLPNYDEVMPKQVIANRFSMIRNWERGGIDYEIAMGDRVFIQFVRTEMGAQAVEGGYTHLLMLDDDALLDPDFLKPWLDYDVDIVAAPYRNRKPPHELAVKRAPDGNYADYDNLVCLTLADMDKGLQPVDRIGTHVMLIKTSVFTSPGNPEEIVLKNPVFNFNDTASFVDEHNGGRPLFSMPLRGTEDMLFCHRAKRKGFGVYCDTDRFAGHMGERRIYGKNDGE